ncbi:MAG TPA: hypothetical protein VKA89_00735 [Solirubrobacterales bacterium]|nr:hypothetical protein [Solirubrobacterales bacterium]
MPNEPQPYEPPSVEEIESDGDTVATGPGITGATGPTGPQGF